MTKGTARGAGRVGTIAVFSLSQPMKSWTFLLVSCTSFHPLSVAPHKLHAALAFEPVIPALQLNVLFLVSELWNWKG